MSRPEDPSAASDDVMGDSLLVLAQIDDASGECLGKATQALMARGARNVQLLSSLTKKGRPGYVLLVDADASMEEEIAEFLLAELGVWGYHVLESRHRHASVELRELAVGIRCGSIRQVFTVRCKCAGVGAHVMRVKVDEADVLRVCSFLEREGCPRSQDVVRAELERVARLESEEAEVSLEFQNSGEPAGENSAPRSIS